ncbi:MAG: hypothetical protein K2M17_05990 [Bacilli bacterium]|nr:hypothetical protein [Bacilli bacterium]
MKGTNKKENQDTNKKSIIMIIALIIILLALITSCSCTSRFFGKIGEFFHQEEEIPIDEGQNEKEIILNKDLIFDTDSLEMSIDETDKKISFSFKNIYPQGYTCTTSNADIATCTVSNGYVIINAKQPGNVTVYLETETNGKIYQASIDVTITESQIDNTTGDNENKTPTNTDRNIYYLSTFSKDFEIGLQNGVGSKNIIINTNLFKGNIIVSNIKNGIRLTSSLDKELYIDITTDNKDVKLSLEDKKASSSIVIKASTTTGEKTATITVKGSAHNKPVKNECVINLAFVNKYTVIIDANGGYYNSFTDHYEFLVNSNTQIDLQNYISYKPNTESNCEYYDLLGYDTNANAPSPSILIDTKENATITITKDIHLYAIYKKESDYKEVENNQLVYLTEVNLFHNEEYYQKYGKDKIIYPGAEGSYIMTFDNTDTKEIKLKSISLEEIETVCIENKGCLNMGYVIKYADPYDKHWTYFYGSETEYSILNGEKTITFPNPITIPQGKSAEISLLWKWVESEETDELDTLIGKEAAKENGKDLYKLRVGIRYSSTDKYCSK